MVCALKMTTNRLKFLNQESEKEDPKDSILIPDIKDSEENRVEETTVEPEPKEKEKKDKPKDLPEKVDQYIKSGVSKEDKDSQKAKPKEVESTEEVVDTEEFDSTSIRGMANLLTEFRRKVRVAVESDSVHKVSDKSDVKDFKKVEKEAEEEDQSPKVLDEKEER